MEREQHYNPNRVETLHACSCGHHAFSVGLCTLGYVHWAIYTKYLLIRHISELK